MKRHLLLLLLVVIVAIAGCKKDDSLDKISIHHVTTKADGDANMKDEIFIYSKATPIVGIAYNDEISVRNTLTKFDKKLYVYTSYRKATTTTYLLIIENSTDSYKYTFNSK